MSNPKETDNIPSTIKPVDWSDFRDHIATADQNGRRRWLYPRKVDGKWFRWRTWFSWLLLTIMFAGPFITIQGNPLLMMNVPERKFVILGQVFWPQDFFIFAVALLLFLTGIFVFTAAFGRLWCGWTCPQTIMMEMVFRKIEYLIEGDSQSQRKLDEAPLSVSKLSKKLLKHFIFLGLSFLIGNLLLSYIIGWQQLRTIVTEAPSKHLTGLGFMTAFSLLFYGIFARFREQACTFICPYGRHQSTLIDENTILVAYDYKRGEKRGQLRSAPDFAHRANLGMGDCVDCKLCVSVCPTGIDIRDGVQMECVQCTACIDACDKVMDKVGSKRGLIRYASLNGIERGEPLRITLRIIGYSVVLCLLAVILGIMLYTRADAEVAFLRAPGAMFQVMGDGHISNLYTVRVVNKTSRDMPVELRVESPAGSLRIMGGSLVAPPQKSTENSALVEIDPALLINGVTPVVISAWSGGKKIQTVKTAFIGPRN